MYAKMICRKIIYDSLYVKRVLIILITITDNYVVATDISDDDVVQEKDTVIELSLSSAADTTGEVTDGDN